MEFFDKLVDSDLIGPDGSIRGCFDESFHGIMVSDRLREMLLNEESEAKDLFAEEEKSEFIFELFRIISIGGALCQADSNIHNYLSLVKSLYRDTVTVYRDSKENKVQLSGKAYKIEKITGVELFPKNPDSPNNALILIIDPLKKVLTVIKQSYNSFW